jgi:hypothetical protein
VYARLEQVIEALKVEASGRSSDIKSLSRVDLNQPWV